MSEHKAPPNKVRELRLAQDLTQQELADRAEVSLRTISAVENHEREVLDHNKRRISNGLGLGYEGWEDVFPKEQLDLPNTERLRLMRQVDYRLQQSIDFYRWRDAC
ncbi:MAG: helix-turn-helix transcriptional regulator [Desulfobacteraceae bacterium]|nr:helix-turn-helix transcriptional regulator [Desulfobacteraceae bacterium]